MSTPTVSIITPTYNHERFIGPCIESVLAQTFSDWEMIIVDDASTDGTPEIVRRYDDPRITYIRQDHVGPYRMAETYNRALAQARGDFIAILEGDDLWPPYKLAEQLPLLQQDADAVASYGRAGLINEDGQAIGLYLLPRISGTRATTADFLLGRSALQPVTVLLRRTALTDVGGFVQHSGFPAVDLPTWLRLSMMGGFAYHDAVLGLWRVHRRQVTGTYAILPSAVEIASEFFQSLPPAERDGLGVSEVELRAAHGRSLAEHNWSSARAAMRQERWSDARSALRATWRFGNAYRRAQAAVSYAATLIELDPNPMFERMARTHLGWQLVERYNPLAREQHPDRLIAALEKGGSLPDARTDRTSTVHRGETRGIGEGHGNESLG